MAAGFLRRILGQEPEPVPEVPRAPTSEDLLAALDRVEEMARDGAVPPFVESRVDRVVGVVRDTIPRLGTLGAGSAQGYNVMATATDYLPEAIAGYLRLPRDWADTRPVDRGRTSLMVLVDQLDLLAATMDKVFDAVCRADAVALVAHERFLQEKFGHASTGGDLALGATPTPPPPPPAPPPVTPPTATTPGTPPAATPVAPQRLQPPSPPASP